MSEKQKPAEGQDNDTFVRLKAVDKSGFPFQLKVKSDVEEAFSAHGWRVASTEHPWVHNDSEGFIDLVLSHTQLNAVRLVIECKRVAQINGGGIPDWIFLRSQADDQLTQVASTLTVEARSYPEGEVDEDRVWDEVLVTVGSLQSEFCVKADPLLESLASGVLACAEGLANEELSILRSQRERAQAVIFIFPAIVTNARLLTCTFDPASVSIETGRLDHASSTLEEVPFIRFRKSLMTAFPEGRFNRLEEVLEARERTVFVINAASLVEFLSNWDVKRKQHLFRLEERRNRL